MTITIDIPAEIADQISAEADRLKKNVPEIVQGLVEQRFRRRPLRPYDPAAFIAALDSFTEGDAEEQRQSLEYLKLAVDRNRPGERSIFGEGFNPVLPLDEVS